MSLFNFSDGDSCDFDWDSLGFGLMPTDYMYIMKCAINESFERGQISRYGNIELSPSAGVLNYGQVAYDFIPFLEALNLVSSLCLFILSDRKAI